MVGEYIGPATFYNDFEMIILAIIALVVGIFIGYFLRKSKQKTRKMSKKKSSALPTDKHFNFILRDTLSTKCLCLVCESSFSDHVSQLPGQTNCIYEGDQRVYSKIIIGRETDCHLCVSVGDVSRHHCEISIENGDLFVSRCEDNLTNAVYCNRKATTRQLLKTGDMLQLGSVSFSVQERDINADELAKDQPPTGSVYSTPIDASGELETK